MDTKLRDSTKTFTKAIEGYSLNQKICLLTSLIIHYISQLDKIKRIEFFTFIIEGISDVLKVLDAKEEHETESKTKKIRMN